MMEGTYSESTAHVIIYKAYLILNCNIKVYYEQNKIP